MGPIDVLVAKAGVGRQAIRQQVDDELWDQTFAVNVTASWQLTRAAAPGMVELGAPPCAEHWGGFGRILYMSSIAAIAGGVIGPHYAASKAAQVIGVSGGPVRRSARQCTLDHRVSAHPPRAARPVRR